MVKVAGGGGVKGSGGFSFESPRLPSGKVLQYRGRGDYTGISGFRVEVEREGPGPLEQMIDQGVAVRGASVEAVTKTTEAIKQRIRDYIDAHFTGSRLVKNNRRRVSNAAAQSVYYDELESKGQY